MANGDIQAVRRKPGISTGERLGVFKGKVVMPFEIKARGQWRRVLERGNGSLYIITAMGEVTVPADLRMVLETLPLRNADSGRTISRVGRSQAIGGSKLHVALAAAQILLKRDTPKGKTEE